jgi:MFS family permease
MQPERETGRDPDQTTPARPRSWLTRGVAGVGLASFFSDAGHEMATSVLPTLVTSTLRSSAGALGVIEGVSDALIGVSKLVAGPFANDRERRLRMARGGYVVTAAATGALGFAQTVLQVGVLRATAWVARGGRSPARDAMLATLAPREAYGRAFGLERAGDNLGAVVGPLLAAALISLVGIRETLWLSVIPGLFAAVAITIAAAEARRATGGSARAVERVRLQLGALRAAGIARPLLPIALFELGNCATTLLILRATELLTHGGRSVTTATSIAVLVYAAHNVAATVFAYGGGHRVDRIGGGRVLAAGAAVYVLAYLGFASPLHSWPLLLVAFLLAGIGIGLAETAESVLLANQLPDRLRGSGFGVLGAVQAFGDLGSSLAVGLIWSFISPTAAFLYAAAWMALSLAASAATGALRGIRPS